MQHQYRGDEAVPMIRLPTVLFAGLTLLAALIGRGGKTLTRAKAQEVITGDERLKRAQTYPFIISRDAPAGFGGVAMVGNLRNGYLALQSEGYISITFALDGSGQTALTEKGRDAIATLKWKKAPLALWPSALWVPVATPQIVNITGITSDENIATAEFDWRWKLTPIGERLTSHGFRLEGWGGMDFDPEKISKGQATLKRYDDGWRVMDTSPEVQANQ
jgi:hypothetical protein